MQCVCILEDRCWLYWICLRPKFRRYCVASWCQGCGEGMDITGKNTGRRGHENFLIFTAKRRCILNHGMPTHLMLFSSFILLRGDGIRCHCLKTIDLCRKIIEYKITTSVILFRFARCVKNLLQLKNHQGPPFHRFLLSTSYAQV